MASSLALRLQHAQCEAAAYERAAYRTDAPLLPLALARTYLLDHPLPRALGVGVADVHRALLALHCHARAPSEGGGGAGPVDDASSSSAAAPAASDRVRDACAACGGRPWLDEREGCYVCDGCGAVLSRSVNVVPEYMAPPELPSERLRQRGVPGVSQAVLERDEARRLAAMSAAEGREAAARAAARLWRADLERWNHLVHLGTDDLRYAERLLGEWSAAEHAREARLAAALLYPRVREQIPEAHEVRRWVQRAATLPADERPAHAMPGFVDATPAPQFACAACGTKRHSRRDARFHCRAWGGGADAARRKRRRL